MKTKLSLAALLLAAITATIYFVPGAMPAGLLEASFNVERARHGVSRETLSVNGRNWVYLDSHPQGCGNCEVILALHGFTADKDNWMRFAKGLVNDYRLIAPDLPGFGETSRVADEKYTLALQAQRVKELLGALNIQRVHVTGNSMGGHLTAIYTHHYPQDVLSMGLMDAAGVAEPVKSPQTLAFERGESPQVTRGFSEYQAMLKMVSEQEPFIPLPAKRYFANIATANADHYQVILDDLLADDSSRLEPYLPYMQQPTLIMWGRQDRSLDVSSVAVFEQLLPNAQSHIFENTGHLPMVERPAESAAVYRAFLQSL